MDFSGIDNQGYFLNNIVNGLPTPYDAALYEGMVIYDTVTKKIYIGTRNSSISLSTYSFYFSHLYVSSYCNYGIRGSDGTAWAWGGNESGNLGDGSTIDRSSPVSVLGGISFAQLYIGYDIYGIRGSDGTAWAWGYNSDYGVLGDGSTIDRSSPVSVLGGISFTQLYIGYNNNIYGIRGSDGTAWAWGDGSQGYLGIGDMINYSSPVLVI